MNELNWYVHSFDGIVFFNFEDLPKLFISAWASSTVSYINGNWPLPHGHLWEYWPNVIDRRDAVTVHLLLKNALKYKDFSKIYENLSKRCCLQTYSSKRNFFSSYTVTENTALRFGFLVKCEKKIVWKFGLLQMFILKARVKFWNISCI